MSNAGNHRLIRVPASVYDRLAVIAREIDSARLANGRAYANVPQTEQGTRGEWTPLHAVITRALDEFQAHRNRSNRRR